MCLASEGDAVKMRAIGLMALLVGSGCTWVSEQDVDARLVTLDDDNDGYIASEDCDDSNTEISPGATEIWYDGIDSDCLGDDDYDADKDGYVSQEHVGLGTLGVSTAGLLPGGDCDDANDIVHPGAPDGFYDGVDSDCGGEDDYDADGDGSVSDRHLGLATSYVDTSGALPGGDCDDTDADINTDAEDAWYDGVDADCAGDDDYDADGDGFVRDSDAGLPTQYVTTSGLLPAGDCDDDNAAIYTNAPDTWYDGLDYDCAGDDDFDQDGDGYVPTAYAGSVTEGVKDSGALPDGDCDDTDARTNPGEMEELSEGDDRDCDQGGAPAGGTSFYANEIDGYTSWVNPSAPRFDENVLSVFLSISTEQVTSSATYYDSALAITFDGLSPLDGPQDEFVWLKHVAPPSYELTDGHDFLVTNEYLFGVTGLLFSTQRSFRLGGFDLISGINSIGPRLLHRRDHLRVLRHVHRPQRRRRAVRHRLRQQRRQSPSTSAPTSAAPSAAASTPRRPSPASTPPSARSASPAAAPTARASSTPPRTPGTSSTASTSTTRSPSSPASPPGPPTAPTPSSPPRAATQASSSSATPTPSTSSPRPASPTPRPPAPRRCPPRPPMPPPASSSSPMSTAPAMRTCCSGIPPSARWMSSTSRPPSPPQRPPRGSTPAARTSSSPSSGHRCRLRRRQAVNVPS